MNLCNPHWDGLRKAIEFRGMGCLIDESDEVQISPEIIASGKWCALLFGFHMIANQYADYAIKAHTFEINSCPLCEAKKKIEADHGMPDGDKIWINGCTDAMLTIARNLGRLPAPN